MAVVLYTPCEVRLESSESLVREIPDPSLLQASSGYDADPLGTGFDHTTVFYDIFLSANSKELVILGPPLLNLEEKLFPAKFSLLDSDGRQLAELTPQRDDQSHYVLLRFALSRRLRRLIDDDVHVRCRFANGLGLCGPAQPRR